MLGGIMMRVELCLFINFFPVDWSIHLLKGKSQSGRSHCVTLDNISQLIFEVNTIVFAVV